MSSRFSFWINAPGAIDWTLPAYLSIGTPSADTGVVPMTTTGGSCSTRAGSADGDGAGDGGDWARAGETKRAMTALSRTSIVVILSVVAWLMRAAATVRRDPDRCQPPDGHQDRSHTATTYRVHLAFLLPRRVL